jgi:hypothetical protein
MLTDTILTARCPHCMGIKFRSMIAHNVWYDDLEHSHPTRPAHHRLELCHGLHHRCLEGLVANRPQGEAVRIWRSELPAQHATHRGSRHSVCGIVARSLLPLS